MSFQPPPGDPYWRLPPSAAAEVRRAWALRELLGAWAATLPAGGWVGTAEGLLAELDAVLGGHPDDWVRLCVRFGRNGLARELPAHLPAGWVVRQRRTAAARLIEVVPAGDSDE